MQELGQTLRAAREAKGLTLADAEESTRIRLRYLEALEAGDTKPLPVRVYAEGFLRNYAIFLGLPAPELLARFRRAYDGASAETTVVRPAVQLVNLPPRRRSPLFVALVLILVALVITIGWYTVPALGIPLPFPPVDGATATATAAPDVAPSPTPLTETTTTATPEPLPTSEPAAGAEPTPTAAPTAVPPVVVEARFTALTWLRVTVDGRLDFEGFFQAGTTRTWTGTRAVAMVCGNAGGTEVTVDGVNLGPLGAPGQVVEIAWTRP